MVPNHESCLPQGVSSTLLSLFLGVSAHWVHFGDSDVLFGDCSEQLGVVTAVRAEPGCLSLASGPHKRPVPNPLWAFLKDSVWAHFAWLEGTVYSDCYDTSVCSKQLLCVVKMLGRPSILMVRKLALAENSVSPGRGPQPWGPVTCTQPEQRPGLSPGCQGAACGLLFCLRTWAPVLVQEARPA